jgi:hypothetical protein
MSATRLTPLAAFACLAVAAAVARADEVAVTPYRPSVSTPAALSAPGWLEIEAGLQRLTPGDGTRRDSLPVTLKLALSEDWGLRVGGDAVARTVANGTSEAGRGDAAFVLKRRFAIDEKSAWGLEVGSARDAGHTDFILNGIFSADFGARWHTDVNFLLTRFGAPDTSTARVQKLWAAALSETLTPRWGWVGEFSGTKQAGADSTAQFLLAASFSPAPSATLDFGFARGIGAGSPRWTLFLGGTFLAARFFSPAQR